MIIIEKTDDVTQLPVNYVIAHCISVDCAMGAGVVIPIRKKFPELKKNCQDFAQKNGKKTLGKAYRYEDKNGTVYNLFSKEFVYHKAGKGISYETYLFQLKQCLEDLRDQMIINNEDTLGIPKIGCGLDCCKWEDVKEIIKKVFSCTNIYISVCLFD